jgi:hypothetical protein
MGAYLDRLTAEYDEVMSGVDATIDRAAEENRDVTDDETAQVTRDRERLTVLRSEIERYAAIERDNAEVSRLRATLPAPTQRATKPSGGDEYDVNREFPTVADWAITMHRAMALRDSDARERLERATAHQMTTDNPGLIPRPILGPVLAFLQTSRAFINSITNRPLPTGKFDRPTITQHVAIGKQAVEKDLTASQKMVIGTLPVVAATYAGHLNISRQDIKWTSPAILQIVFDDFAAIYSNVTDNDAADQFVAGLPAAVPIAQWDAGAISEALYTAAANSLAQSGAFPDTLWTAPDVWGRMGALTNNQDAPVFPTLSVTSQGGNPMGLRLVVDPNFAAGTMVVGPSRFAEWYEDVDGLMQVGEPDVLGQLVGYAGYGAFVNVRPEAFTAFGVPAPVVAESSSRTTTASK